jgi:hypothetical protein
MEGYRYCLNQSIGILKGVILILSISQANALITILAIGSWREYAGIATRYAKTAILIILAYQG